MARSLRIEYPVAVYYITLRGRPHIASIGHALNGDLVFTPGMGYHFFMPDA